jgi:methionine sulfoxide reductase heme-binding subunit
MSSLATATGPHLFWIVSRAAGILALVLSSASVTVGLSMGGRFVKRRGLDLRSVHEALSLATIVALVVHAVSLLGDGFLSPSIADLTIPFVSAYERWWTTLGILSGWSLILLGLSYYARTKIGIARWRTLHRFTALAWLGGLAHSLGEGSDAGEAWFLVSVAAVTVPALALLAARLSQRDPSGLPQPSHDAARAS